MSMISIIVPVYKTEKYLERCIRSLVNQTYQELEIILVDDGSPDNCPVLCDEWKDKDKRIKVVHKKNGGLSSARNTGLTIATGKYVAFVDSDDDVELDMYRSMHEIAEKNQVDFVMSDYTRIESDGSRYIKSLDIREGFYDRKDIIEEIFPVLIMREEIDYGPLLSVCHCMYRLEFLKNINLQFDEEVRWSEDNMFSAIMGYQCENFYYMKNKAFYHYYQNPGTITTSYRKGAWGVYCIMNERLHNFFDNVKEFDFSRQLKLHMIYYACNCIEQIRFLEEKERFIQIKEILYDEHLMEAFQKFRLPNVSFRFKIQLLLMKWRVAWLLVVLRR